jgi:hypothetical protein
MPSLVRYRRHTTPAEAEDLEMVRMHLRHDAKITIYALGVIGAGLIVYGFWRALFG